MTRCFAYNFFVTSFDQIIDQKLNMYSPVKHVSRHELPLTCFSLRIDKPVMQSETKDSILAQKKKRDNFLRKCIRDRFNFLVSLV
jgi:hypothetical protein